MMNRADGRRPPTGWFTALPCTGRKCRKAPLILAARRRSCLNFPHGVSQYRIQEG